MVDFAGGKLSRKQKLKKKLDHNLAKLLPIYFYCVKFLAYSNLLFRILLPSQGAKSLDSTLQ